MKVRRLIEMLQTMPLDANVHLDDEGYPEVDGCYLPDPVEYSGDEEDMPPTGVILLEVTHSKEN